MLPELYADLPGIPRAVCRSASDKDINTAGYAVNKTGKIIGSYRHGRFSSTI